MRNKSITIPYFNLTQRFDASLYLLVEVDISVHQSVGQVKIKNSAAVNLFSAKYIPLLGPQMVEIFGLLDNAALFVIHNGVHDILGLTNYLNLHILQMKYKKLETIIKYISKIMV